IGTGQFRSAIPVLTDLRESGNEGAGVENLLAQAYAGNDQVDQAFDALYKAQRLAPNDEKLYLFVAAAFQNRQSYSLSLQVVDLGLRHLPNSARLHYERGYLLSLLDDVDGAKGDFELAARLAPRNTSVFSLLAAAYRKRGQPEQAQAMLATLVKLNEEQVRRIRSAPGDAKAIPGASRIDREQEKP